MIYVNGKPVAGFGSGKSRQFSVSLPASGWIENEQIVSNDLFKSSGYAYLANPDSDSYLAWVSSQVRPEDEVAVDGKAVFICAEAPASDITVNIIRMEVKDGSKFLTMVGGGSRRRNSSWRALPSRHRLTISHISPERSLTLRGWWSRRRTPTGPP